MPYIKQEDRIVMDLVVKTMVDADVRANGDLNYILFSFCKRGVVPSYNNYKNFCGELRQCVTEIERRLLGPYEEDAMKRNGDI
jgi:hypothetical protein